MTSTLISGDTAASFTLVAVDDEHIDRLGRLFN